MLTLNNEERNDGLLYSWVQETWVEGQWQYNCSPFTLAQAGKVRREVIVRGDNKLKPRGCVFLMHLHSWVCKVVFKIKNHHQDRKTAIVIS